MRLLSICRRLLCAVCLGILSMPSAPAQELEAKVTFNVQQLETAYRDRFETLQNDLSELINNQQWTTLQFANQEKIACTFAFVISSMPADDTYKATLTVQASRPVYYSTYNTSTLNWKDNQLTFTYTEGQMLNYNAYQLDNELIAVSAYYVYLILGLDFDSFSPRGGEAYFQTCSNIVAMMQSSDGPGWKAFDSDNNRHALITALLAESQSPFRDFWYTYHRLGLDAMYQSMDKGRNQITSALPVLKQIRSVDAKTPLLSLFINSKLDELVNIWSEAPMSEKNAVYEQLRDCYPTYSSQLSAIKKEYKE